MKFSFTPEGGWEVGMINAATAAVMPYLGAAQQIIADLGQDGLDYAQALASQRLHSTAQKYLSHLKKVQGQEGVWTIILESEAVYLEEGFSGFDQIAAGLAQGPKSQYSSKTGRRYVKIPFEHIQEFAKKGHPQNPVMVQKGSSSPTTKGDLAADLKRLKQIFAPKDTGITRGAPAPGMKRGDPLTGKIWSITKSPGGPQWEYREFHTDMRKRLELEKQPSPLLSGITKVQFATDKGTVKSRYLTWRTATDPRMPKMVHDKPNWVHPGFAGIKVFADLEQYLSDELANRINQIFSQSGP